MLRILPAVVTRIGSQLRYGGEMASIVEVVDCVLGPYVGRTVADTCVRGTALSLGKTSDSLGPEDLPRLEENIRKLLGPIASGKKIDSLISEIEGGVTA